LLSADKHIYAQGITIPVVHKLLVKKIVESADGEYTLIGTMIHHQVGCWKDDQQFPFMFNDESTADATAEAVRVRRREMYSQAPTSVWPTVA